MQRLRFYLFAVLLLGSLGCGGEMTGEVPQNAVRVVISGVQGDAADQYYEQLQNAIEGSSRSSTMSRSGGSMTVQLSPVSDPKAFAEKISFGKVVSVQGRVITVDAGSN